MRRAARAEQPRPEALRPRAASVARVASGGTTVATRKAGRATHLPHSHPRERDPLASGSHSCAASTRCAAYAGSRSSLHSASGESRTRTSTQSRPDSVPAEPRAQRSPRGRHVACRSGARVLGGTSERSERERLSPGMAALRSPSGRSSAPEAREPGAVREGERAPRAVGGWPCCCSTPSDCAGEPHGALRSSAASPSGRGS